MERCIEVQYLIEQPDGTRVPITQEKYTQLVYSRQCYHVIRDEWVEVVKAKRGRMEPFEREVWV